MRRKFVLIAISFIFLTSIPYTVFSEKNNREKEKDIKDIYEYLELFSDSLYIIQRDYVEDVDNLIENLVWDFEGNVELIVNIDDENGVVTIETPNENWFSSQEGETIIFTVTDLEGLSDSDDAIFIVLPVNDLPEAEDKNVEVNEDSLDNEITLVCTDVDNDNAGLTYIKVTDPAHGTLEGVDDGDDYIEGNGGDDVIFGGIQGLLEPVHLPVDLFLVNEVLVKNFHLRPVDEACLSDGDSWGNSYPF